MCEQRGDVCTETQYREHIQTSTCKPAMLFPEPIIVLDTETTGTSNRAEIIELGAVCLNEYGQEVSSFSTLIQPNDMGPHIDKALAVNNIRRADLMQAQPWHTVGPYFVQWVNSIPVPSGSPINIAFNAPFDKRMLENHGIFLRWGQCAKQRSYQIMKANHAAPRNKNGGLKQPNLAEACNYFDVPLPDNAHRALDDARATAHLVCAIHRAALET